MTERGVGLLLALGCSAALAAGCTLSSTPCADHDECGANQACIDGFCVRVAQADAGAGAGDGDGDGDGDEEADGGACADGACSPDGDGGDGDGDGDEAVDGGPCADGACSPDGGDGDGDEEVDGGACADGACPSDGGDGDGDGDGDEEVDGGGCAEGACSLDAGGGDGDAGVVDAGAAVCGNTLVEPGEDCDDGNAQDDDGCSACQFAEEENNFNADNANDLELGVDYLANVNVGDDWFRIDVNQDDAYRVRLLPRVGESCADLNSLTLEVRNSRMDGTTVFYTSDAGMDCPWAQWVVSGADGERFVRVVGSGTNVNYRVLVEEFDVDASDNAELMACATPNGTFCGPDEGEPNDAPGMATPIAIGVPAIGEVTVGDDDYFTVMATDDDPLLVELFVGEEDACGADGLPYRLRLRVELSDGVELAHAFMGLGDCEVMVIVTHTGQAVFRVDSQNTQDEDIGPYAVLVSRYVEAP